MRDGSLLFLFEIKIPDVTIDQRDDDRGTQHQEDRANVIAKIDRDSVNPQPDIKRERETKELIRNAELNVGAALQKAPDRQSDHERGDKGGNRERGSLRVERESGHRYLARIILASERSDKRPRAKMSTLRICVLARFAFLNRIEPTNDVAQEQFVLQVHLIIEVCAQPVLMRLTILRH